MIEEIRHTISSVRYHPTAYKGIAFGFLIPLLMLGWISIGYSRINQFLLLMVFPFLNGVVIVATSIIMVRAEGENFLKLLSIPEGARYSIIGALSISSVTIIIENALFVVATTTLKDTFAMLWSDSIMLSDYTPDLLEVFVIIGIAVSLYACYISFVPWMLGHLKISTLRDREQLLGFKRFITESWFLGGISAIILQILPIWMIQRTILTIGSMSFVGVAIGILTIVWGMLISILMWREGFVRIRRKLPSFEIEDM